MFFEYGQNKEGYWGYNHIVSQLEYCVDCVKTQYPNCDFIFLFDHSSGHTKKQTDGLDRNSMNRSFSGNQPHETYLEIC